MENFKNWLLEKEYKMSEMGTGTNSVAVFLSLLLAVLFAENGRE